MQINVKSVHTLQHIAKNIGRTAESQDISEFVNMYDAYEKNVCTTTQLSSEFDRILGNCQGSI